jgi:hypothetical protein
MRLKNIFLIAISILLFSCSNTSNKISENVDSTSKVADSHHSEESEKIELNNGEKWVVDSNMIIHIRNIENDVNSFSKDDNKDFKTISKKIQSHLDLLTSNCTMTGKAHDELHKWLLPFIDLVKELSDAKDMDIASEKFKDIQTSFLTFNTFFK